MTIAELVRRGNGRAYTEIEKAPLPKKVVLDWTDFCNAKCFFCGRAAYEKLIGHPGGFISFEQIKKIEHVLKQADVFCMSSAIGEPLLHPELDAILKWLYDINPSILLQVVTNGTSLGPQKAELFAGHLDWLSVSLNASNAEAHTRDMFPDLLNRNVDVQKRWDRHIRLLTDFISALPPSDRSKIRFQMVTHRYNIQDVVEFVRLVKRMGGSYAALPNIAVHPETVDWSLYWIKDEYNEMIEEACHVGAKIGVHVNATRFYTSVKPVLDLDKVCLDPVEVAYVSRSNVMAPCCQWSEPGIAVDTYSDDGFDKYWNSDVLTKLRKKRDSQSCKVCGMSRVFDETSFHFSPYLKKTLIEAGKLSDVDSSADYPDAALVKACVDAQIDLPNLRRTLLQLNLPVDLTKRLESHGLSELPKIERECWAAFESGNAPISSEEVALGKEFLGVGWGPPIYTPDSYTSGRSLCGSQRGSVYIRAEQGVSQRLSFYVNHITPDLEPKIRLEVLGQRLELGLRYEAGARVLTTIIPPDLTARHGGRLWVRIGCLDHQKGLLGHISFSHIQISKITESDLLKHEIAVKEASGREQAILLAQMESRVTSMQQELESVYKSRSWRMTAPIRAAANWFRNV